jgi:hypothetical protein
VFNLLLGRAVLVLSLLIRRVALELSLLLGLFLVV